MRRITLLAVIFLVGSVALAVAADKYTVPPAPALGLGKCAVAFDAGSPSAVKGQFMGWTVTGAVKYNYDTAWTFSKLEVYTTYTKGTTSRDGPASTVTDETTLASPGSYSITFSNMAAPAADEKLVMTTRITVRKAGSPDEKNSTAKDVPAP